MHARPYKLYLPGRQCVHVVRPDLVSGYSPASHLSRRVRVGCGVGGAVGSAVGGVGGGVGVAVGRLVKLPPGITWSKPAGIHENFVGAPVGDAVSCAVGGVGGGVGTAVGR